MGCTVVDQTTGFHCLRTARSRRSISSSEGVLLYCVNASLSLASAPAGSGRSGLLGAAVNFSGTERASRWERRGSSCKALVVYIQPSLACRDSISWKLARTKWWHSLARPFFICSSSASWRPWRTHAMYAATDHLYSSSSSARSCLTACEDTSVAPSSGKYKVVPSSCGYHLASDAREDSRM